MLPTIGVVSFFSMFYIQKWLLLFVCKPSKHVYHINGGASLYNKVRVVPASPLFLSVPLTLSHTLTHTHTHTLSLSLSLSLSLHPRPASVLFIPHNHNHRFSSARSSSRSCPSPGSSFPGSPETVGPFPARISSTQSSGTPSSPSPQSLTRSCWSFLR